MSSAQQYGNTAYVVVERCWVAHPEPGVSVEGERGGEGRRGILDLPARKRKVDGRCPPPPRRSFRQEEEEEGASTLFFTAIEASQARLDYSPPALFFKIRPKFSNSMVSCSQDLYFLHKNAGARC